MKKTVIIVGALLTMLCVQAQEENATPRTFARFVPERQDDFAWENDVVAFRAYGPQAREKNENSGIDCWLKRVDYPIINKWYSQMNEKSYHKDWGEGHDPYHVGKTAGCGGTGLWIDGQRVPLEAYTDWKINKASDKKTCFTLGYEMDVKGSTYREEKTITIAMGDRYYSVESKFFKDGEPAKDMDICVGITTHDGKATPLQSAEDGWVAAWETIEEYGLGTAVMVSPKKVKSIETVSSTEKDESHILIIMTTDCKGRVKYKSGYGWEKEGTIKTQEDWSNYLSAL